MLVPVDARIRRSAEWCWCPGPGIRHGAERCRCLQVLDEGQQALAARSDYNFDHPDAFDFELLVSVLRKLKKGKSVKVPVYDFTTHSRRREWVGAAGAGLGLSAWVLGKGSTSGGYRAWNAKGRRRLAVIRSEGLILRRLWVDLQTGQCRYEGGAQCEGVPGGWH